MKNLEKIEKALFFALIMSYLLIIVIVSIQVICRIFPFRAPAWTEEASRYSMIYLVAFSTGFAIKEKAFVGVDTIFHFLTNKKQLVLKFINNLILIGFSIFFLLYSIDFYKLGKPQTSVTMKIFQMNHIYFSMILFSFLMLIYLSIDERKILKEIKKNKKKGELN